MNKAQLVVVQYVQWKLKHNETIEQKYFDYLSKLGLLEAAIKGAKS